MSSQPNPEPAEARQVPPEPPAPALPSPPSAPVSQKSPGLAVVLSFLPGLGHVYLGQYERGAKFFAAMFVVPWILSEVGADAPAVFAGMFIWAFTLIDAYRQAQYVNLGYLPERLPKAPVGERKGSLGFGIFLVVVGFLLLVNRFYHIDFAWLRDWWPAFLILFGAYLVASWGMARQKDLQRKRAREIEEF